MSDQNPPEPERQPAPPSNRSKLMGRLIVLGFGALLLIYFVPLLYGLLFPSKN